MRGTVPNATIGVQKGGCPVGASAQRAVRGVCLCLNVFVLVCVFGWDAALGQVAALMFRSPPEFEEALALCDIEGDSLTERRINALRIQRGFDMIASVSGPESPRSFDALLETPVCVAVIKTGLPTGRVHRRHGSPVASTSVSEAYSCFVSVTAPQGRRITTTVRTVAGSGLFVTQ